VLRLNHLRDFIDIVEAGSIRAAARRRGISQPVLTKALKLLEGDVGVRLLDRSAHGIRATAAGNALLARARAAHAQLAKALEEIGEISGNSGGIVAFGASASGLVLLPKALMHFHAQYPRSYVRIVEGAPRALMPLLREQNLDFFLGPKPVEPLGPQIRIRPLFRLPLAVAGRQAHPRRHVRSLAQLTDLPWLLFSAGRWENSLVGNCFKANGLSPPASITQCESYSTALSLLSETDTIGLLPRPHLSDGSLRERIREIPVGDRLPELTFSMYLRADDTLTRPAAALLRAISSSARTMMMATD
jgi:DNA-binding transcriptional LysR family regulator